MSLKTRSTRQAAAPAMSAAPRRPWAAGGLAVLALAPAGMSLLHWADSGVALAALYSLSIIAVLATNGGRAAFTGLSGLTAPALCWTVGLAALILAMTPLAIGGVHPFWTFVDGPGAAVLDREAAFHGLLTLAGLAGLFLVSAVAGARSERARQTVRGLLVGALVAVILLAVASLTPLKPPEGLVAVLAGLSLLLAAATATQAWKAERPRSALGRLRVAPASSAVFVAAVIVLGLFGGVQALASAGFALLVFAAWEVLASGGEGKLRRGPTLVVLGLIGVAALAIAVSALAWANQPGSPQSISDDVHWRAALASPWAGYGAGSLEDVARLSMDRLNLAAMRAFPRPSSSYLAALEQVGVLALAPFVAAR
jgi:hypothetical protein